MRNLILLVTFAGFLYFMPALFCGCAQIGAPTGGPKDTLAPVAVRSDPPQRTTNFDGNSIRITMNEYIELQNISENVLISPLQKRQPNINYNLKTISIKFKDSLLPNTTYTINFGNAIKDVREGNILKNYTYTFSTGSHIDSLKISGRILVAETGLPDSTILAYLYKNTADSAVQKLRPDYIARPDNNGKFEFQNLPAQPFRVYALKDGDGGRTYNAASEFFAFTDSVIVPTLSGTPSTALYAYAVEKTEKQQPGPKLSKDNKLQITTNLKGNKQDLLDSLTLRFNSPIKPFDLNLIKLTDSSFHAISGFTIRQDSTLYNININYKWQPETYYILTLPKSGIEDTLGHTLAASDTIRFQTKKEFDYGRVVLRFSNLDLSQHPIIQFLEGDKIKAAFPITQKEWINKRFPPGEFGMRILFDTNQNGKWDPGNFETHTQPEKVILISQKLSIRADWDNEREIKF